jgi:hypothetical protein
VGLTSEEHWSDRCATTQFGIFKAEDTRRDRMACVEVKQGAVAGHPSDGENLKTSKTALRGLYPQLLSKGISDFRLPPYNRGGERMASISWNPSSFSFLFFLPIFLGLR